MPLHVQAQIAFTPYKETVKVGPVILVGVIVELFFDFAVSLFAFALDSIKAVNVELSLKGPVLGLVEIAWHNASGEFLWFVDLECFARWKPGNDAAILIVMFVFTGIF